MFEDLNEMLKEDNERHRKELIEEDTKILVCQERKISLAEEIDLNVKVIDTNIYVKSDRG